MLSGGDSKVFDHILQSPRREALRDGLRHALVVIVGFGRCPSSIFPPLPSSLMLSPCTNNFVVVIVITAGLSTSKALLGVLVLQAVRGIPRCVRFPVAVCPPGVSALHGNCAPVRSSCRCEGELEGSGHAHTSPVGKGCDGIKTLGGRLGNHVILSRCCTQSRRFLRRHCVGRRGLLRTPDRGSEGNVGIWCLFLFADGYIFF
mmetsp:Transcript_2030/g.3746  ORF Transcript_2030/g.3746 Transcript_2030/m.3746 type:complete len:203 (-) Transcript_2030:218-826(-)